MSRIISAAVGGVAFLLGWLTGPIFTKELRVSGRRFRHYLLRCVYVLLLAMFIGLTWHGVTDNLRYSNPAARQQQMALAGKAVIATIIWFQFTIGQLIAVVLLSNSISDEIRKRTLGTLMTTPINSFQVVIGKIFSKMWQILALILLSLPVLALLRAFGGIPVEFLLAGLTITFAAILHAACWTLFFSIFLKRSYWAIIGTIVFGALIYIVVPVTIDYLADANRIPERKMLWLLTRVNPFAALAQLTVYTMDPVGLFGGPMGWPWVCVILLGSSAVITAVSVVAVRRQALNQALGGGGRRYGKKSGLVRVATPSPTTPAGTGASAQPPATVAAAPDIPAPAGKTRNVFCSPVLWRELLPQRLGKNRFLTVSVILLLLLLAVFYGVAAYEDELDDRDFHGGLIGVYTALAVLVATVVAPVSITSEKESRSWDILLATPLENFDIIMGKFLGAMRKTWLPIALILLHMVAFTLLGYIEPLAVGLVLIPILWSTGLFCATGIWFGTVCKGTTTAVVANLALVVVLWLAVPGLLVVFGEAAGLRRETEDAAGFVTSLESPVQAWAILDRHVTGRSYYSYRRYNYDMPCGRLGSEQMLLLLLGSLLGATLFSGGLLWTSARNLRNRYQ